jgi:hypothetical protein
MSPHDSAMVACIVAANPCAPRTHGRTVCKAGAISLRPLFLPVASEGKAEADVHGVALPEHKAYHRRR